MKEGIFQVVLPFIVQRMLKCFVLAQQDIQGQYYFRLQKALITKIEILGLKSKSARWYIEQGPNSRFIAPDSMNAASFYNRNYPSSFQRIPKIM